MRDAEAALGLVAARIVPLVASACGDRALRVAPMLKVALHAPGAAAPGNVSIHFAPIMAPVAVGRSRSAFIVIAPTPFRARDAAASRAVLEALTPSSHALLALHADLAAIEAAMAALVADFTSLLRDCGLLSGELAARLGPSWGPVASDQALSPFAVAWAKLDQLELLDEAGQQGLPRPAGRDEASERLGRALAVLGTAPAGRGQGRHFVIRSHEMWQAFDHDAELRRQASAAASQQSETWPEEDDEPDLDLDEPEGQETDALDTTPLAAMVVARSADDAVARFIAWRRWKGAGMDPGHARLPRLRGAAGRAASGLTVQAGRATHAGGAAQGQRSSDGKLEPVDDAGQLGPDEEVVRDDQPHRRHGAIEEREVPCAVQPRRVQDAVGLLLMLVECGTPGAPERLVAGPDGVGRNPEPDHALLPQVDETQVGARFYDRTAPVFQLREGDRQTRGRAVADHGLEEANHHGFAEIDHRVALFRVGV